MGRFYTGALLVAVALRGSSAARLSPIQQLTLSDEDATEEQVSVKVVLTMATGPLLDKSNEDKAYKFDNQVYFAKILASGDGEMWLGRVKLGPETTVTASTPAHVETLGLKANSSACAACIECVNSDDGTNLFNAMMYNNAPKKQSKWCGKRGTDDCHLKCATNTIKDRTVTYDRDDWGSSMKLETEAARAAETTFTMVVSSSRGDAVTLAKNFKSESRFYIPIDVEGNYRNKGKDDPIENNVPSCEGCYFLFFRVASVEPYQ